MAAEQRARPLPWGHHIVTGLRRAALLAAAASVVLAAFSAGTSRAEPAALEAHTLTLDDGRARRYFVYRPPGYDQSGYGPSGRAASGHVVLVLHGSGGSAARLRGFTAQRFERLADEEGFLVIYPEGFEGNWNGCRRPAPFTANRLDVDDVGFLRALVEQYAPAKGRALAFGFSHWFAERNGHRNGSSSESGAEADADPLTSIAWRRWRTAGLPEVAQVTVHGGGHTIPQPGTAYPALVGPHTADIDAPLVAWGFFERNAETRKP